MADEETKETQESDTPKDAPVRKAPRGGKKLVYILVGVVLLQAVGIAGFLFFQKAQAEGTAAGDDATNPEKTRESIFKEFFGEDRSVLDVGEVKVPTRSTQPRAPKAISITFHVVIAKELGDKLAESGEKGGSKKGNIQEQVLILNIRSILRAMMDADGIRLLEPSAKADFERRAKEQLNQVQIDGDEEKARVLKVLRGQVLQVIVDHFDAQNY